MDVVVLVLTGVLAIGGALFVLVSAVSMLRVRDGVSRVNVLSPATGLGLPMIVLAAYVNDVWDNGFDLLDLIKALVAILGFVILSSVASNALARSAYRTGAPLDPDLSPNELAEPPPGSPRGTV